MKKRITALLLILCLLLTTLIPGAPALAEESAMPTPQNESVEEIPAEEEAPDEWLPGDEPASEADLPVDSQPEAVEEVPGEDAPPDESFEVPDEELPGEEPELPGEPEGPEEPEVSEMPEGEGAEEVEEIEGEAPAEASKGIAEMDGAAAKAVTGGTCGSGVVWRIEGNKLIISGKGKMNSYDQGTAAPWLDFAEQIEMLVVKRGVTKLGDSAFMEMTALHTVKLAEGVTDIGDCAFAFCDSLDTLYIPKSLKYVHRYAFRFCGHLTLYYAGDEEQFNRILFDRDDDWERNPFLHSSIWYAGIDWKPGNDPDFEDEKPVVEMHMGALQAVNVGKKTIEISGVRYSVTKSIAKSMRALITNKSIQDKTVIYRLKNYAIDSIYSIYDVVKIAVRDRKSTTDLYYWDGLYEKSRLEKVTLTLEMVAANPKKYYSKQELKDAGASLIIDRVELKASAPFRFEKDAEESEKKNDGNLTMEIPATTLGFEAQNSSCTLDVGPFIVNTKKKPGKGKTNVTMSLTPHYTSNPNLLQKHRCTFTVNINNLGSAAPGESPDTGAEKLADGMYSGALQGVNAKKKIVMIDERRYAVEQPFADSMKNLLDNKNIQDKTVVYKIKGGNLESVYGLYDVVQVAVKERAEETDLKYEDGAYDKDRLENLKLTLEIREKQEFDNPYTIQELREAKVSLRVDKLELQTDSKPFFFFEVSENFKKKNVKKLTADISGFTYGKKELLFNFVKENMSHELNLGPLVVNAEKAPGKGDVSAKLSLTPHYSSNSSTLKKHRSEFKLYIENLDIKEDTLKKEKEQQRQKLKNNLSKYKVAAIDFDLNSYLTKCGYTKSEAGALVNRIQDFLTVYLSQITASAHAETLPRAWSEKLGTYLGPVLARKLESLASSIKSKILSKFGLSNVVVGDIENLSLKPKVTIEDVEIDFDISLTVYFISGKPYGSMATIKYAVRNTSVHGIGTYSGADLENFANIMIDYLKIAYDKAWGDAADKIAKELIGEPYKILFPKDSFSGTIFSINVDAVKQSIKK